MSFNIDKFDDAQRKAILHFTGPCIVVAPAGSGKTSVLINRIAYLVKEKDVSSENVLALTFSKKACEEMTKRARAMLGDDFGNITISTYHSLCYKYEGKGKKLLTNNQKSRIIDKLVNLFEQKSDYFSIAKSIPYLCKKKICLEMLSPNENAILNAYINLLDENSLFTYDILMIKFVQHIENDLAFRKSLQEKHKFILVDECQDNNASQYLITRTIAAPENNIFFVGDDDQSIYSFMGSSISEFYCLKNIYKDIKTILLSNNYRCDERIINISKSVIQNNTKRFNKEMVSGKKSGNVNKPAVHLYSFENTGTKDEFICSICKSNIKAQTETAVLFRNKYYAFNLILKLIKNNIPFYLREPFLLFDVSPVREIHSYLNCISGTENKEYIEIMLRHTLTFISEISVNAICERICMGHSFETAVQIEIDALPFEMQFKKRLWSKSLEKYCCIKNNLSQKYSLKENISAIENAIGIDRNSFTEEKSDAYEAYLFSLSNCNTLFELNSALRYVPQNDDKNYLVLLYTIHSSKGKEFDTVILTGMEENVLPSSRVNSIDTLEEERRVCYVGMTRAISQLIMIHSRDINKESRFFIEAANSL
jgi:DNA helicase-2/ATP-dependent DNA helicase PcrA